MQHGAERCLTTSTVHDKQDTIYLAKLVTKHKVLEISANAVNFVIAKDQVFLFSIIIFKKKERRVLITQ